MKQDDPKPKEVRAAADEVHERHNAQRNRPPRKCKKEK
jgi:hypothetical protein